MPRKLSPAQWAAHFATLEEDGFCVIESYFDGADGELAAMAAAQHRVLDSWEKVKSDPPAGLAQFVEYPCSEHLLNRAMIDHPLIANIAAPWLGTDDVHIRVGVQLARYPGFRGDTGSPHFDNGNNSLMPKPAHEIAFTPEHRKFSQMGFWTHLESVGAGQAPLQLIRRQDGNDMAKAIPLVCPAGTVCCFSNYLFHSAGNYVDAEGQRFTWGFGIGRADHHFEGFKSYTQMGQNPHFKKLIRSLSPRERCYFRFPKPGDAAYTPEMLRALDDQYGEWDPDGEYASVAAAHEASRL